MNKYESIVVFRADMEDEAREALLERFKEIIATNGEVESVEDWGVKQLAYDIEKQSDGYFYLINFDAAPSLPRELERNYRISDKVLRYNVMKKA